MFRKRQKVTPPARPTVGMATHDEQGGFVVTVSMHELVTLNVGDKVTIRSDDSSDTFTIQRVEPSRRRGDPIRHTLTRAGTDAN